ncbi:MAG: ferritin-like domain-containing protein [Pseudomonadota bacterium]
MQHGKRPLSVRERLRLTKRRMAQVATAELATHSAYLRLSQLDDSEAPAGLAALSRTAQEEDMDHYRLMRAGLIRLRGVPVHPSHRFELEPWIQHRSLDELLRFVHSAEAALIRWYREICALTIELDYQIFDLAFRNLQENAHHQAGIANLLETPRSAQSHHPVRGSH